MRRLPLLALFFVGVLKKTKLRDITACAAILLHGCRSMPLSMYSRGAKLNSNPLLLERFYF